MSQIEQMWAEQLRQQANWHDWALLTPEDKAALTKELSLHLYEEIGEFIRTVDRSRFHVLQPKPKLEPEQAAYDAVEAFKLIIALSALHGVAPEMFAEQFQRVTKVVDDKWRGQRLELSSQVQVLLCDLDGCAADWVSHFRKFALDRGVTIADGGFNDPALEPLKDEFDRTGAYLDIQPMPGAVEALRKIKEMGIKLVIVTARPYHRFKRVYADTLMWCEKVGISYDHIMFFRDKAEAVRKIAPARILAFVEDRAKHAIEVALTGVRVLKMPCETKEDVHHANIVPVRDWDDVFTEVLLASLTGDNHGDPEGDPRTVDP